MNYRLRYTAWLLPALVLLLATCTPKPKLTASPSTVSIEQDTLKDDWTSADLFRNELKRQADYIDLSDSDTARLEIRAFQQRFFDDTTRLKPTWVVGYVRAETRAGDEALPGPVLRATYGKPSYVRYVNRLAETMRDNKQYPLLTLGTDTCRWYPIVYDVRNPRAIDMVKRMLYPKPTQKDGITICRGLGTADSIPEMSTYYSTTVHLHGANVSWHNDGYVNSSFLQTASPFQRLPILFGLFGPKPDEPQQFASYAYPNTFPEGRFDPAGRPDSSLGQHGAILWYHDHSMMRTTVNVYAGLAGAYIIEGKDEYSAMENVYPNLNKNRNKVQQGWDWMRRREDNDIPLVIADKSFSKKGFLYYQTTGSKTNSDTDTAIAIQPEFLGNTITVNGKIWPFMRVKAETYRFRLLNASSTRFYRFGLRMKHGNRVDSLTAKADSSVFVQIGTEGGLMTNFVRVTAEQPLTLAPGERADVLIDFRGFTKQDSLVLVNYAPNEVYQDDARVKLDTIDKDHLTNMVMAFVMDANGTDNPERLSTELNKLAKTPEYQSITANLASFQRVVNQSFRTWLADSASAGAFTLKLAEAATLTDFPSSFQTFLGPHPAVSFPMVLMSEQDWNSEASARTPIKRVQDGTSELWAIRNETGDRHPIHVHLNRFKILGRRTNDSSDSLLVQPNELGWKDVVQCPPGQTTYVQLQYLLNQDATQQNPTGETAQFVYHCHILEHEDASMMRRLVVAPR